MKGSKLLVTISSLILLCIGLFIGRSVKSKQMSKEDISPEAKLKSAAPNKKTLPLTSGASLLMSTYSLDEIFGRIKEETEKPLKDQNYAQLSILFNEWVKHSPLEALDYAQEQGKDDWI